MVVTMLACTYKFWLLLTPLQKQKKKKKSSFQNYYQTTLVTFFSQKTQNSFLPYISYQSLLITFQTKNLQQNSLPNISICFLSYQGYGPFFKLGASTLNFCLWPTILASRGHELKHLHTFVNCYYICQLLLTRL
jgi:hypothetical protein